MKNIGFFNHAVAGLSEIIGIIFLSFALGLGIILFKKIENQFPYFLTIFLVQFLICINFWRYVFTNSPGETNLKTISVNAIIFSIVSLEGPAEYPRKGCFSLAFLLASLFF